MGAFIKSVCWGAFAGSLPWLLISVPFGLFTAVAGIFGLRPDGAMPLLLMPVPFLVALPITAVGLVAIGLPLRALLQRMGRESLLIYTVVGALAGAILLHLLGRIWGFDWLTLYMGGTAGGVSMHLWARDQLRPPAASMNASISPE